MTTQDSAESVAAALEALPGYAVRGRWPGHAVGTLRVTYALEAAGAPLDVAGFEAGIRRAVATWNATGLVLLAAAGPDAPADVTLAWRRGYHGPCEPFGSDHAVAHAGPAAPQTFVHFDADRPWSPFGESAATHSVFHTALHELGHVFGLGHSAAADALMNLEVERAAAPAAADLAGLHSLYGGGVDRAGDLAVTREDASVAARLRLVAPPQRSGFAVFDTDGNGRAEVLVWRTDAAGHGAVSAYHFDRQCRLERSTGPFLGVTPPGLSPRFVRLGDGRRLLVGAFANGRRIVREFDEHGTLVAPTGGEPAEASLAAAAAVPFGDLDGDGRNERVTAIE